VIQVGQSTQGKAQKGSVVVFAIGGCLGIISASAQVGWGYFLWNGCGDQPFASA
jgi:hypothetical protein